jgi:hypothetical protein
LHIDVAIHLEIGADILKLVISHFSVHFQENETHYPTFFHDFAVPVVRKMAGSGQASIAAWMSSFLMNIPAADVSLP